VRLSPRTGNVLIEFDQAVIDEPQLLALAADRPVAEDPPRSSRQATREPGDSIGQPKATADGWLRAQRSETFHATRPGDCVAALLEFERYPEWQRYVTSVKVYERDERGRGLIVRLCATFAEREIEFTTRYRFPSPNRVVFAQDEGAPTAVRGSWTFRSLGRGRTRATCVLEVKPGWRLSLLLRGSLYEQIRDAGLDHVMGELRGRVQGAVSSRPLAGR